MGGFKAPAQYVKAPPGLELAPDPEPPLTFFNAWKCKKRALLSVQNFKAHRNCPHPSSLRKRLRSEVANGQRLDAQMEKLHPPLGRRRDVGDLPPMRGSERLLKIYTYNISAFPPCAPIYIYCGNPRTLDNCTFARQSRAWKMWKREGNGRLLSRRHYNVGKCPVLCRSSVLCHFSK